MDTAGIPRPPAPRRGPTAVLAVAFPAFRSITARVLCSAGKINKRGHPIAMASSTTHDTVTP